MRVRVRVRVLEYWTQLGVGGFEAETEKGETSESWAGCCPIFLAIKL